MKVKIFGRTRICRLAQFALFAFALVFPLKSYSQAPQGISGKWIGSFDIVHADGSVDPDSAYFSFAQTGDAVTGTAGNSAEQQSPIVDGKVVASSLTYAVPVNPQMTVKFELALEGDHLRGTARGIPLEEGSKVVIDATRADDSWHSATAIVHAPDGLTAAIAAQDKKLFDAYNNCDLTTLGAIVTDDLEFYHDKTGLSVGRAVFVDSIKNNICGKVQRRLVPGTMEVYRLNHYGAIEIGVHRFYHPDDATNVGEAKFVTVWQYKDGQWKVSRVLSFDHEAAKK